MQITGVQIRNFRKLKQIELAFQKTHCIIGENGCGKTAILEALDVATNPRMNTSGLSEEDFNIQDDGDIEITITTDKYFGLKIPDGFTDQILLCNGNTFKAKRRESASPGKVLSEPFVISNIVKPLLYNSISEISEDLLPEGVLTADLPPSVKLLEGGITITRKTSKPKSIRSDQLSLFGNIFGYPNTYYFGKERSKQSKIGFNSLLSRIVKELNWRYRRGLTKEELIPNWDKVYSQILSFTENKKPTKLFSKVKSRLSEFSDADFDKLELSLLELENPFSKGFFSIRDGLNQISAENLGSGISLLLSYFLLENYASTDSDVVYLIDEPELHLHPQFQRKLSSEFYSNSLQTIYSTHSPLMTNFGEWSSITRLEPQSSPHPKKESLDEVVKQKSVALHLQEIKKYYQDRLVFLDGDPELLFGKNILLVEGPAEKYGIPKFTRILNNEMPGITIISANGKGKLPYYSLICKAFGLNYFTVFDLDGKSLLHSENAAVLEFCNKDAYFHFKDSFETALGINSKSEHKASKACSVMDEMKSIDDIPKEVSSMMDAIIKWNKRKK